MANFLIKNPKNVLIDSYANVVAWATGYAKRLIAETEEDVEDFIEVDFDFYFDEMQEYLESEWNGFLKDTESELKGEVNSLVDFVEDRFMERLRKFLQIGG